MSTLDYQTPIPPRPPRKLARILFWIIVVLALAIFGPIVIGLTLVMIGAPQ